ncbi:MAG: leucine-rich repeat protein [Ruminococcus sp.]|nr:leucine-rich repeat protein [Ruminococcus sp.]
MKITNRIIALLLSIVMISAFACLSVSAVTLFPVADWVYHKINNDTEFEIYDYTGTQTNVFTPYTHNLINITTVGANAFDSNTTMQKLTLSKYITTVSHHAFQNCTSLKDVVFQSVSVTSIDDYAFSGCTALESVDLENTLIDTVSQGAFMNCDALTEISLPETVTSIEKHAFGYCESLAKVVVPATVTSIDAEAFYSTPNVVIYCYENSLAHRYAVNNDMSFVLIDEKETYMLGDADNDGIITVLDATFIQLVLALKVDEPEGFKIRADVDVDGISSIMDATTIQCFEAGLLIDTNIGKIFEY